MTEKQIAKEIRKLRERLRLEIKPYFDRITILKGFLSTYKKPGKK